MSFRIAGAGLRVLEPVFHLEAADALKVGGVARDEDQSVGKSGPRDKAVADTDGPACAFQFGGDECSGLSRVIVQGQPGAERQNVALDGSGTGPPGIISV